MKIALVYDALFPTIGYGGTERVVADLATELARMGHGVTLLARPGSQLPGVTVLPVPAQARGEDTWSSQVVSHARNHGSFDLVHLHAPSSQTAPFPTLITIHGNGQPNELFHPNAIFVSRMHAQLHGANHWVHNGLDWSNRGLAREPLGEKSNRLAFLAKAIWKVKNASGAKRVAHLSGMPLDLMGGRSWPFQTQRWISRRLSLSQVTHWGEVNEKEKTEVLLRARALLFPVRWNEPFGLAIIEALAAGGCVLGTPYGSLPELVLPEVGFLSTDAQDLSEWLRERLAHPERWPAPAACRQHALNHFSSKVMAANYLKLYETLLREGTLSRQAPHTTAQARGLSKHDLLPWSDSSQESPQ